MTAKDFFATDVFPNTAVTLIPCLDAFVGGDILSGLYFLDLPKKDSLSLFIDLGTNGEMVLGKEGHLLATSVAAGPALIVFPFFQKYFAKGLVVGSVKG